MAPEGIFSQFGLLDSNGEFLSSTLHILPLWEPQWTTVQNISILYKNLKFLFEKSQNYIYFTFFEGLKNVLEPIWTIVPNLLHFGWNSRS